MISVVIGAVGHVPLTRLCVDSVRAHAVLAPEIVLVDNGSTPAESAELASLADIYLHADEMLGYPKAINWGVRAAAGDYVVLLNNDAVILHPGWDARLQQMLEAVPGAEIVAATVVTPERWPVQPEADLWESDFAPFVCVIMRRDLFSRLGPLDEAFGLGNWEDNDYCFRVRQAGGRILIAPETWVWHLEHQTYKSSDSIDFDGLLASNKQRFLDKWHLVEVTSEEAAAHQD